MNRYFSSFFITLFIYLFVLFIVFYFLFDKKIIYNKPIQAKTISLNHIKLATPVLKEVEPKKENIKKIEKKTKSIVIKKRKILKQKIAEKIQKKELKYKKQVTKSQKLQKSINTEINEKKDYLEKHLALIRELINKNIVYSKKAKKLNIQGIVIVRFKIKKSGKAKDIIVFEGNKFLKKSAIDAVRNASKYFPKTNKDIEIQLPIEFKLI